MTTINSARAICIDDDKDSLKAAMDADVPILTIKGQLLDSHENVLKVKKLNNPRLEGEGFALEGSFARIRSSGLQTP